MNTVLVRVGLAWGLILAATMVQAWPAGADAESAYWPSETLVMVPFNVH